MASTAISYSISTAPLNKKWTFSAWIKRSNLGTDQTIFEGRQNGSNLSRIVFRGGSATNQDSLQLYSENSGTTNVQLQTARKFKDVNGWYHIVVTVDSTLSTEADRAKIYVNGVRETSFLTSNYPAQDYSGWWTGIGPNVTQVIGSDTVGGSEKFSGLMSHVHYTIGYAYQASTFGSTDSTTGEWKINASPSVTYGATGFFILKDGNSLTDQSPNTNNFTVGAGTLTKSEDNPSNVFATLNPLYKTQGTETYASGNNTYKSNSNQFGTSVSTIAPNSGKWYFEIQSTFNDGTKGFMGFMDIDNSFLTSSSKYLGMSGTGNCGMAYYGGGTIVGNGNSNLHTGLHDWDSGNVIGCALDIDNNKAYFHVNGTYLTISGYVQNPSSGQYGIDTSSSLYGGAVGFGVSSKDNFNIYANFGNGSFHSTQLTGTTYQDSNGQGIFKYQPPTNFLALCTKNLNV